jgi:hypothetical protein
VVARRIVHLFVDAEHNRQILVFGRRGDNYFFCPGIEVQACLLSFAIEPS